MAVRQLRRIHMQSTKPHSSRPSSPQPEFRATRRAMVQAATGGVAAALALGAGPHTLLAQSTPEGNGGTALMIPVYPYGEELSLDPHRAVNWGPHWVILPNVWAGLLRFNENGAVVEDLASSVEAEEDGLVWVATIRSDAVFASGRPVTAEALIDGWRRALDPLRPAPMSSYMRRVEGFDAFVLGEAEELGFEARDEQTVAIRLSEPYALFPEDLATFVWAAVDVDALDGIPDSEVPLADASAGGWRFVESENEQDIPMVLSESSPAPEPTGFDTVIWRAVAGPQAGETALNAYQNGDLAIADVTAPIRPLIEQDEQLADELHTIDSPGSTMLIAMDYRQAPFDDPVVRRAVAASIDRERWANEIMNGTFTAASSITPPVLSTTANYAAPEPIPFDPDAARSLISDAGISEEEMPTVTYYQAAESTQNEFDQSAALLAMIEENSGLIIEHDTTLSADQIDALRSDNGGLQFDLRWWWPLTNSPSGLADIGLPTSPAMGGWFNWSSELEDEDVAAASEEFVTTINEALTTMDATERTERFAQAEEILVEGAVYVPLGHWVQEYVQSPTLTGTRQGAFTGYAPVAFDDQVSYTADDGTPTG